MPDFWEDRVRTALGIGGPGVGDTDTAGPDAGGAGTIESGTGELGVDGPRSVADIDPKRWHDAVRACRDDVGCDFFDWLSAVDEGPADPETEDVPPGAPRIRIVAHLWSVADRRGVLLRALLTEGAIASVTDLYPGADWHERETHEMFGVDFPGHPDLKPLLLTPEFEGHPLRKDFVLASRVVKPWPGAKEPGEGQGQVTARKHRQEGTVRKRAPKRPPGVPEDWIEPRTSTEPIEPDSNAPPGTAEPELTTSPGSTEPAPKAPPGPTDSGPKASPAPTEPPPPASEPAPDSRTRRPDAP